MGVVLGASLLRGTLTAKEGQGEAECSVWCIWESPEIRLRLLLDPHAHVYPFPHRQDLAL